MEIYMSQAGFNSVISDPDEQVRSIDYDDVLGIMTVSMMDGSSFQILVGAPTEEVYDTFNTPLFDAHSKP